MKKLIYITFLSLCVLGCKKEQRTDYIIKGSAEGLYNGIRVYLNRTNERGALIPIDTSIVINEKFNFKGKIEYPKLYYITANGQPGRLPIMLENSIIDLEINSKSLINSNISGSESNKTLKDFESSILNLKKEAQQLLSEYREANTKNDKAKIEEINKKISDNKVKASNFGLNFIQKNNDAYVSIEIFKNEINRNDLDLNLIINTYKKLDEKLKITPEAKLIKDRIDFLKKREEAKKATEIGAIAPEFSAPNPEGKQIALSDVVSKGKITIIDFWAAWCGPCRRENPNVVNVYNKYHDKGLEIIGVGLDGRRGQQNPKETWVKAIEDDNLTWHQVSNLRYFDEIAKLYNVGSIPSMFVLDSEGKIVAKNLRGIALENKISELLN